MEPTIVVNAVIHLGIDAEILEIRAIEVTSNRVDDAQAVALGWARLSAHARVLADQLRMETHNSPN